MTKFKEKIVEREVFECPKCKKLKLILFSKSLSSSIKNFIIFGEEEDNLVDVLNRIGNDNGFDGKIKFEEIIKANKLDQKPTYNYTMKKEEDIRYCGLEPYLNTQLGLCSCGKHLKEKWNTRKKKYTCVICPWCGEEVEKANENMGTVGLMCPKCMRYVEEIIEIVECRNANSVFDHVKYDREKKILTLEPYTCLGKDMKNLIMNAEKLDLVVHISGFSKHHSRCLNIQITKKQDSVK